MPSFASRFHAHRHSFFPLVVVLLSLCLLLLVWFMYAQQWGTLGRSSSVRETQTSVTDAEYQAVAAFVLSGLLADVDATPNVAVRLDMIETAQAHMLDLHVPAERRDVHLEAVLALNLMRSGLRSPENVASFTEGRRRLEVLFVQYPWLTE